MCCYFIPGLADDDKVFRSHYSHFCNAITDIQSLTQHFVAESIIDINDISDIRDTPRQPEQVKRLLKLISGPLEAGNSKPFRIMLDIMEKHGIMGTKLLAIAVKKQIKTGVKKEGKVVIRWLNAVCQYNFMYHIDIYNHIIFIIVCNTTMVVFDVLMMGIWDCLCFYC